MKKLFAIALVAIIAGIGMVTSVNAKPILCKKIGKTTPIAFHGEGWRSIAYRTNIPKSFMLYNKKTGKCTVVIKTR